MKKLITMRKENWLRLTGWAPWVAVVIVSIVCWSSSAQASDADEIKALKEQVQVLMQRIDKLEQKQAVAQQVAATTPASPAAPAMKAYWKNGFRLEYKNPEKKQEYTLRLRTGVQLRYSYLDRGDDKVKINDENYSSFTMRRLRLFLDGTAPNKDWAYYAHIQLEPKGAVNTLDGYITWRKYKFARIQFGRMKIPYSMEFWQSGFMQNGADRTIFTGDNEVDFPGGNAALKVGSHLNSTTGFPTGGMLLYRSQGVNLNGYADMFGRKDFLTYWLGVFNGRDTQGLKNTGDNMLYSARLGINFLPGSDPKGPMGSGGFNKYSMQGDYGYNTKPLAALVIAAFNNHDRKDNYYDPSGVAVIYGTSKSGVHDIENYGFDASLMFRYLGMSCDLESGWEEFIQDAISNLQQQTWNRWATRVSLGYFFVPKKWEGVFKAAYFERLRGNNLQKSLASGLGLVQLNDGFAVEDDLQQFILGLNYYLNGFNQYLSADVRWDRRDFTRIEANEAAALGFTGAISPSPESQNDYGLRLQYQYLF